MSLNELRLEELRVCPLCGGPAPFELHDSAPDGLLALLRKLSPPGTFAAGELLNRRVSCTRCRFVFLCPRLDAPSLSIVYSAWYGYGYREIFDDPAHVAERERIFRDYHLALLAAHARFGGSLLDVGCGSGIFLNLARRAGWNKVVGIEFERSAAEFARSAYGLDVRHGSPADQIGESECFDVITMFDYLEHSPEPGRELDRVLAHLADGGVLAIRLPNQGAWLSRLKGPSWYNVISNHLGYFDAPVLRDALTRRGLRVEYASASNFDSWPAIFVRRLRWFRARLGRARAARLPEPADVPGAVAGASTTGESGLGSRMAKLLEDLVVEQIDHIAGLFGRGSNLFVVARRIR